MMRQNKKAQGLSMNVIIIAALALVVLVVLTIIFMGRAGTFRQETEACQNNGGQCIEVGTDPCDGPYDRKIFSPCFTYDNGKREVDNTMICCIKT